MNTTEAQNKEIGERWCRRSKRCPREADGKFWWHLHDHYGAGHSLHFNIFRHLSDGSAVGIAYESRDAAMMALGEALTKEKINA